MSTSRISNSARKTSSKSRKKPTDSKRVLGLSLSGGKADKTALVVLEDYFPEKRIFISHLSEKIRSEELVSADWKLTELIFHFSSESDWIGIDSPLSLPHCTLCEKKCPGAEVCEEGPVQWLRKKYLSQPAKKSRKYFTPYTQRVVDSYLQDVEGDHEDTFATLGSNTAPLTARALFLKRRLGDRLKEVSTRTSVWRLGRELKVPLSHLKCYRNSVGGFEARQIFLEKFFEGTGIFVYQQDFQSFCENLHAFEALICAWVVHLKTESRTEPRPDKFPKDSTWVEFPKKRSL